MLDNRLLQTVGGLGGVWGRLLGPPFRAEAHFVAQRREGSSSSHEGVQTLAPRHVEVETTCLHFYVGFYTVLPLAEPRRIEKDDRRDHLSQQPSFSGPDALHRGPLTNPRRTT
jgi:hypothetical protein